MQSNIKMSTQCLDHEQLTEMHIIFLHKTKPQKRNFLVSNLHQFPATSFPNYYSITAPSHAKFREHSAIHTISFEILR